MSDLEMLRQTLGVQTPADSFVVDEHSPPDQFAGDDQAESSRRTSSAAALDAADSLLGLGSRPDLRVAGERQLAATFEVGRASTPAFANDGRVSRRHLNVRQAAEGVFVQDLGSANGSFLSREGCVTAIGSDDVELLPGDEVLTVGGVVLLSIEPPPHS